MTTITLPFTIGETIWHAAYGCIEERIPCPECAGTRVIEMIKGNGERVALDCAECSSGYDPPRGWVTKSTLAFTPKPFTPRRWSVDGEGFTFSESEPGASCYSSAYQRDLFHSRAECEARCKEQNAENTAENERRAAAHLESKRRSLAHSASYWSGQVRRLEKDLEVARARLNRCKQPKANAA
jgi:hypothetical protein